MSNSIIFKDRYTKEIQNTDGSTTLTFGNTPLAYKTTTGELESINLDITELDGTFKNKENVLKSTIKPSPKSSDSVITETETGFQISTELLEISYIYPNGEKQILGVPSDTAYNYLVRDIQGRSVLIQSQTVTSSAGLTIVDEYQPQNGGLKHNIFIESPPNFPNSLEGTVFRITYRLKTNKPAKVLSVLGETSNEFETVNSITFSAGEGDQLTLEPPTLNDFNKKVLGIWSRLQPIGENEYYLSFNITADTLFREDTQYPLIIDPTVTATMKSSHLTYERKNVQIAYAQSISYSYKIIGYPGSLFTSARDSAVALWGSSTPSSDRTYSNVGSAIVGAKTRSKTPTERSGTASVSSSNTGTCEVMAYTGSSNEVAYASISVTYALDTTAPSISFSRNGCLWRNSSISTTVTASDSQSGMAKLQYAWSTSYYTPSSWTTASSATSVTTSRSSQGRWYLHVKATDNMGNVATARSSTFDIDNTSPSISFSANSRSWSNSNASVTITYSDSGGSGVSTRQYAWSTSTSTPTSWTTASSNSTTVSQSSNGSGYLHARAVDGAGNSKTARTTGVFKVDKTAPSVSFTLDSGNTFTQTTLVILRISSSDSHSGVSQMRFSNDGSSWSSWETYATTSKIWYLTSGNARKTVYVQTRDAAGNTSSIASKSIYLFATTNVSPKSSGSLASLKPRLIVNLPYWGSAIYPHIQLDTSTSFNTSNLHEYNSTTTSSGWVSLGSGYSSGGTAKYDPQANLSSAKWYMRVRYRINGTWTNWSSTTSFTISAPSWYSIVGNSTVPIPEHLEQLRTVSNNVRLARGLSSKSWTDSNLVGKRPRKVWMDELRSSTNEIASTIGKNSFSWTDPTITAEKTKVRAVHFTEIQNALSTL